MRGCEQNRDLRQDLINTGMNVWVPNNTGNFPSGYVTQTLQPLVLKQTALTERPPLVCEVSANFCGVAWSAQRIPMAVFSLSRPEPLLFLPCSPSIVLTRLSGPHFRPTTSQKIWECQESNLRPLDL
jgi:hypothetical protein